MSPGCVGCHPRSSRVSALDTGPSAPRSRPASQGDHTIVIARVERATTYDRPPLLYWRRGYRALGVAA
jgi:hypothetical protein